MYIKQLGAVVQNVNYSTDYNTWLTRWLFPSVRAVHEKYVDYFAVRKQNVRAVAVHVDTEDDLGVEVKNEGADGKKIYLN